MSNGIDGALSRAPVVEREEILDQLVGIRERLVELRLLRVGRLLLCALT
jgi:hypothetical protein